MAQAVRASAEPTTPQQWAEGYLNYLGAPAAGPNDPRVKFLEDWIAVEGTFWQGNVNNPISIEGSYGKPSGYWNSAGVRTYGSAQDGYQGLAEFMQQGYDKPILQALQNPHSNYGQLTHALAASNWTGGSAVSYGGQTYTGQASNAAYALNVASHRGQDVNQAVNTKAIQAMLLSTTPTNLGGTGRSGSWLLQLDAVMNPTASDLSVLGLNLPGTTGLNPATYIGGAQMIVVRAAFFALFAGVAALGIVMLGGKEIVKKGLGLNQTSTALQVAQLATDRANAQQLSRERIASIRASTSAQRERDARARQEERYRHQEELERQRAAAREKESRLVGKRSLERLKAEGLKTERAKAHRAATTTRARAQTHPQTLAIEKEKTKRAAHRKAQQESRERQAEITGA